MRRFEITEIANGWLLTYYTDIGINQRFFQHIDEIVEILKVVVTKESPKLENVKT